MKTSLRPVVWLHGEVKAPPMTVEARQEMGVLLMQVQYGALLSMPHSRPMPTIGPRVHELRVPDANNTWRLIYRIDADAIVVAEVFAKRTQATPRSVIRNCQARFRSYDDDR